MLHRISAILGGLVLIYSTGASAHQPSYCSGPIRADSYGRGIEAGFQKKELKPSLVHEECYRLGRNRGLSLRTAPQIFDCEGDFDRGYEAGFEASASSVGSICYIGGYLAGKANLHIGAREGNSSLVGSWCVDAYIEGASRFREGLAAILPLSEPEASCYRLGYADASDF